ncbi:hypothetical protein BGZ65_012857, partial [Modicella reniformis]
KDIKDRYDNNPKTYLDDMIGMTKTVWQSEARNWTYCDPSKKIENNPWSDATNLLMTICPMEWAKASNALVCSLVWKDYDSLRDYSLDYFDAMTGEKHQFLVQKLIAMSGIRMAAVLNEIYDPPTRNIERLRLQMEDEIIQRPKQRLVKQD